MEYCNGGSLADLIRIRGKLTEPEARNIIKQVLLGIKDLHNSCIMHNDIKPDNIMLNFL
jgi:serine/threonine protein kinase